MSFGSRLRQERDRLRLTQEKFAELGGVKRVSQHLYEQDVRVPDINYLIRPICRGSTPSSTTASTRITSIGKPPDRRESFQCGVHPATRNRWAAICPVPGATVPFRLQALLRGGRLSAYSYPRP